MVEMLSEETHKVFPFVKDKVIVDFVNGLDVANELNVKNKKRSGLGDRILDSISGQSAIRQTNMNDHMINGLEACRQLMHELSDDIEKHSAAIIRINHSLQNTQQSVAQLAHYTAEFKNEFREFASNTQQQFSDLQYELSSTKRLVLADQQLSRLMDKWSAGGFNDLSLISRTYAVIDTLNWGAFGERMRLDGDSKDFIEHLKNKLLIQLNKDLNIQEPSIGILKEDWIHHSEKVKPELLEALEFQGDWCLNAPDAFATTLLATQPLLEEYKPLVPNIPTVERVVKYLVSDSFAESEYVH